MVTEVYIEQNPEFEDEPFETPFARRIRGFGVYGDPFVWHTSGRGCYVEKGYNPLDKPQLGDLIKVVPYSVNKNGTTLFGEMVALVTRAERKQLQTVA